ARDCPRDRAARRAEAPARTHALVRGGRGAVDRDLHALDAKRSQALGRALVDASAVGLELERDAAGGQALEDFPAVRHAERLAAAAGGVGNPGLDDATREVRRRAPVRSEERAVGEEG